MARIESPCLGVCSTTQGDQICRGCKRDSEEILNWGAYTPEQRSEIMLRTERLTVSSVGEYFQLIDKDQLEQQLIRHRIRYTKRFDPLCWVVDLLRAGARNIQRLDAYGLSFCNSEHSEADLEQLYQTINKQILQNTDRLIRERY
ncbi:DUF1289 domain-containing protein [Oceanospirillum sediminis]|uniref:DUF1289 domain-containing protein n=1 Tax=Oceanospirillum sediminis TaxID=2760088 RepID=A0A839IWG1_9GAMM|nr:DUF1289 domain-containing protein [Oceanospirillum sediminis]MBB1489102.1 DUF1289 domain-containing protein [Oceanospirillum sediminis]